MLGAIATLAACTSDDTTVDPPVDEPDPRPPTPAEWDRAVARPDEATAAAARDGCKFARGALPDETLGAGIPTGKDIPIETIVVLMQENRSFDHYFGHLGKYAGRIDIESAPEDASNPDKTGPGSTGTHPWHHAPHLCFLDTNHEWTGSHLQYDDGKMDGFYESNHGDKGEVVPNPSTDLKSGERAMTWYDEREIPYYYALAKAFGIGDHYFCSVLGPTWPNRMYLFAGTSFGLAANTFANTDAYPFPANDAVVLDELDKRHVDWKLYTGGGPPGVATVLGPALPLRYGDRRVLFSMDEFFADAAAGKLPPVVYLDANFTKTGDPDSEDEHPPSNPQLGQLFTSKIVDALFKSPQWSKLAFFMMYDEHGGIYDHVPPPKACAPDDKPPTNKSGERLDGAFDRYGMRVPFLVVSPYAKRGYVSHGVYDHTSILRFIQAKHRLPALTSRDANAAIPTDFFDFQSPPNTSIPELPQPVVDPAEKQSCETTFPR
ncbi:MAG: Acid phosphatase [Labilithrix sp.]|nr:Acid phosphatase [Labilithrix sp.]